MLRDLLCSKYKFGISQWETVSGFLLLLTWTDGRVIEMVTAILVLRTTNAVRQENASALTVELKFLPDSGLLNEWK